MRTRKPEVCAALGAFLLVISGAGVAAPPETPEKIGTAIRNAQKDNANVLVVVDIAGKHRAFPVSGLGEVDKNRITIKKGTFVVVEISVEGSREKIAERFLDMWKHPNTEVDAYLKSYKDPEATIFFRCGKYDNDVTFEVRQVLLIAKK
jgi:hypothetical protein